MKVSEEHAEFETQAGDPIPQIPPDRRRKNPKAILLSLLIIATLGLGVMNAVSINALTNQRTQFTGSSLLSITASFALGGSPNLGVSFPGGVIPFNLTVSNFATATESVLIQFDSTSPQSWTASLSCTPATYPAGGLAQGILTMTIAGAAPVTPLSYTPAIQSPCDGSTHSTITGATFSAAPGRNLLSGHIDVSSSGTSGLTDQISWFATVTS